MRVAILFALAACAHDVGSAPDAAPSPDAPVAHTQAIIVAGDYTAGHPGILSRLDLETMAMTQNAAPAMSVGDDPVIRQFGDELFIVNRSDGNNITILDATTLALKEQLSTGTGSNPQDVAAMGNKLFVPVYGGKGVAVLHRGTSTIDTIDLSSDDPDGHPDCASAVLVGGQLYVACELLDENFSPRGNGHVYVINPATDQVNQNVVLQHVNPFGLFAMSPGSSPWGGDLVIAVDPFGAGCVERIHTGGTVGSLGCVVDNATLGGYASRIDFQTQPDASTVMFMAVAASDFVHANLQGFDVGSGMLWGTPLTPMTQVVGDAVACAGSRVVIADKQTGAANGVRVYTNGTETTSAPLAIGLNPASAQGLVCY